MKRFSAEREAQLMAIREEIARINARFEEKETLLESILEVLVLFENDDLKLVLGIVKAMNKGGEK